MTTQKKNKDYLGFLVLDTTYNAGARPTFDTVDCVSDEEMHGQSQVVQQKTIAVCDWKDDNSSVAMSDENVRGKESFTFRVVW